MRSSLITNCWQYPHRLVPGCIHIHFHFLSIALLFAFIFVSLLSVLLFWLSPSSELSCVSLILESTVASHYYTLDEVHICGMSLTAFTFNSLFLFLSLIPVLSLSWPLRSYNLLKHYSSPDELCVLRWAPSFIHTQQTSRLQYIVSHCSPSRSQCCDTDGVYILDLVLESQLYCDIRGVSADDLSMVWAVLL